MNDQNLEAVAEFTEKTSPEKPFQPSEPAWGVGRWISMIFCILTILLGVWTSTSGMSSLISR